MNPHARDARLSDLLIASASGDSLAFENFYDATARDALDLAGRLAPAPLDEILTAVYLQVWHDCARFNPAHSALEWLLAIVREQAAGSDREGPCA